MPLNSFKSKGVIFMSKLKVEGKVGDINDVIACREQMKYLLNGEEPMDDE